MFTFKKPFHRPGAIGARRVAGPPRDLWRSWGNIVFYFIFLHTHTRTPMEGKPQPCPYQHPDKGAPSNEIQAGLSSFSKYVKCYLLCSRLAELSTDPHGSPAHANRTNPSRSCLSVSLSSVSLLAAPISSFSFFSFSLHVCSTVRQPVLSPHCFPLCPLISPSLHPRRQSLGFVSANCSEACR